MKWIYDRETRELVTSEEYSKRQAERSDKHGRKSFDLPVKFQRGHWKLDRATGKFVKFEESKPKWVSPSVLTDEIPPTESMATPNREFFTSKAKLREHYRQHGMIETGGDRIKGEPPKKRSEKDIRDDVAKALNACKYGMAPMTELEKECCLREQRAAEAYKKRMH